MSRQLTHLIFANITLETAMPILVIGGTLTGLLLAPSPEMALTPLAVQTLVGILSPIGLSAFMQQFGRRSGFLMGAAALLIGGVIAAISVWLNNFIMFCFAHLFFGLTLVCINFFRFAAAEAVTKAFQAKAISYLVASGLVSALIGPEIYTSLVKIFPTNPLGAVYLALSVIACLSILQLSFLQNWMPHQSIETVTYSPGDLINFQKHPEVGFIALLASASHATMLLAMLSAPIVMVSMNIDQDTIADVIRWHLVAMFAPGLITAYLIRRIGVWRLISLGLCIQCIGLSLTVMQPSVLGLYFSLIFVGIGWNFSFIGSTKIIRNLPDNIDVPVVQGLIEVAIAIFATIATFSGGFLVEAGGLKLTNITAIALLVLVSITHFRCRRSVLFA